MNNWPIFHEPWWLDAVAGPGNWGESCIEEDGKILARLPYMFKKKYGFRLITQPPLTQFLGPWFREFPAGTKMSQRLGKEKDFTKKLIEQLPPHDFFQLACSPQISNWLPWYWHGYKQTTRYTYRIQDLSNHDHIWQKLQTKIRGDIRKAEKQAIIISETEDVLEFWNVYCKTFHRQGIKPGFSLDYVSNFDNALKKQQARKIFLAADSRGQIHAGAYIVFNQDCAWYLMGGGDPELRNSGATSLLLWESIKFASTVSEAFDFEGSMIEPIERFFRGFGASQLPYFQISKTSNRWLTLLMHGKGMIDTFRGDLK